MAELTIEVEEKGTHIIMRLSGRMDAASSAHLETKLEEYEGKTEGPLLLDFSRVEYLSSAGMRLLLSWTKKLKGRGLKIFATREEVMEIIRMAGFEKILEVFPGEAEALGA